MDRKHGAATDRCWFFYSRQLVETALPPVAGGMESGPELCPGQEKARCPVTLWLPGDHPTSSGPVGSFIGPGTRLGRTLVVASYKKYTGVSGGNCKGGFLEVGGAQGQES